VSFEDAHANRAGHFPVLLGVSLNQENACGFIPSPRLCGARESLK